MRNLFFYFLGVVFFLGSCTSFGTTSLEEKSLEYAMVYDDLVACAASPNNTESTALIWYKTRKNEADIRLWYSDTYTQDLSAFQEETPQSFTPLFQGFMGRFNTERTGGSFVVSVETADTFIYSKPIEILPETQPTIWSPEVNIDQTDVLKPRFSWEENTFDSESLYFHLLVNTDQDQAVSATYSVDTFFQFYDLSNVVFNVTEQTNPVLEDDMNYQLTLMQVSNNNWVSAVTMKSFDTL